MPIHLYTGPDPEYLREILVGGGSFANDANPELGEPEGSAGLFATTSYRRSNNAPLTMMMVLFAFFDANEVHLVGGTCGYTTFFYNDRQHYGCKPKGTSIYHKSGASPNTTYDMKVPVAIDVTKHRACGIALNTIVQPVGAVRLALAIQELR